MPVAVLSESNEPQQRTKRFLSQESSPSTNANKTPAFPQQQSVSNTQEQPNTSKNVLFIIIITFLLNKFFVYNYFYVLEFIQ